MDSTQTIVFFNIRHRSYSPLVGTTLGAHFTGVFHGPPFDSQTSNDGGQFVDTDAIPATLISIE